MSIQALFEKIVSRFSPSEAEGLNVIYAFEVEEGANNSVYFIKVANNTCNLVSLEDSQKSPDVTLKASRESWEQIISGSMPAQMAFMMGKLQISGEFPLALKLPSLFSF